MEEHWVCKFCNPTEWIQQSDYACKRCKIVTELPYGLIEEITGLWCFECDNLTYIPSLSFLTYLECYLCPLITYIPKLPQIKIIYVDDCILLTVWKQRCENVTEMECRNTPLLHLDPSLFIRFNGVDRMYCRVAEGNPRPRNGVSFRFVSAFTVFKKLCCFELPSRVALEVSFNAILYAPGGKKYLELADRYKDGIPVYKKMKL